LAEVTCRAARDRQTDRAGGLRPGADDHVVKPLDIAEPDARIQAVARRTAGAGAQEIVVGGLRLMPDDLQVLPHEGNEVCIHRLSSILIGHGVEIVTVRGFGYLLRQSGPAP
jgi:DNA-binding response OmpR family regulator